MPLEQTTPSPEIEGSDAGLGATPRMSDEDSHRAGSLSLRQLRPPLHVPGYEQEVFLGRGAFGEVWKAVDSNSGREVAIKFYSRRGGLDWSHMAREVEKLQHLFSDRDVVQLLGIGWEADPPYYVMEYMPYGSLEDRLRSGPMPVSDAVAMIRDTARGLVHAHDKGILHCDLKPGNIMLDQDGHPRLADFGQARLKHDRAPSLGTLFYMAPEQADLSASPDAQWDVYALGTIFYRLLTGKLPYLSDELSTSLSSKGPIEERLKRYRDELRTAPPPTDHKLVPGVDHALAEIIDRCLAVDPKHRYRNVQSVLTALESRTMRRRQRSLLLLGVLGPALVVFVMGVVAAYLFRETLSTAQRQLVDRTLESDQFAAKTVAAQFALGLDKRWRILEQDAADPDLRRWLVDRVPSATSAHEIARWLEERHVMNNAQFSRNTAASYWFVLDREGRLRGISPPAPELLGRYFGFREYFHGQGRELTANDPVPNPIQVSHRSNVFRSHPTNRPAVAFSTPIFSDGIAGEVVGILAMETELGHFSDFFGSRNQFAVLVDLRPDSNGKRGLIVEHPYFDDQLAGGRPLDEIYLPTEELAAVEQCHDERAQTARAKSDAGAKPSLADVAAEPPLRLDRYRDPIGNQYAGEWLAACEPVFVARAREQVVDSGWAILLQERRADTLMAFDQLRSFVRRGGWVSLGLVVIVIGALWAVVIIVISPPTTLSHMRWFRGLAGPGTSSSASLSSRSINVTPSLPTKP
jgi:serine/threonine protein kinase